MILFLWIFADLFGRIFGWNFWLRRHQNEIRSYTIAHSYTDGVYSKVALWSRRKVNYVRKNYRKNCNTCVSGLEYSMIKSTGSLTYGVRERVSGVVTVVSLSVIWVAIQYTVSKTGLKVYLKTEMSQSAELVPILGLVFCVPVKNRSLIGLFGICPLVL